MKCQFIDSIFSIPRKQPKPFFFCVSLSQYLYLDISNKRSDSLSCSEVVSSSFSHFFNVFSPPLTQCVLFFLQKICAYSTIPLLPRITLTFFSLTVFCLSFFPSAMWHLSSHAYSLRSLYRFRDSTVEARYRAVQEAGTRGFIVMDASPFTSGEVGIVPPFNRQPFLTFLCSGK